VRLQWLPLRSQKGGEGVEGKSVGRCLMRGNRGGTDDALLPLLWSTGGRPMAAHSVAVPARPTAAQAAKVGDEQGSRSSGPQVLVGRMLWWASKEK
jgi:hypothetical protein